MAKHLQSGLHGGPHDLVHAQRLQPLPFASPVRSRDDVDLRIEFESELCGQVGGRRVSGRDPHEFRGTCAASRTVSLPLDPCTTMPPFSRWPSTICGSSSIAVVGTECSSKACSQSLLDERPHPAKTAHDGVIDHVRYAFILSGSIRSIASQKSESTSECVERKRNTGHDSRRQCHGDRGGNHGQREDVLPEYAEIGRPLSDDEAELSDLDHPQTGHDRGWRKISG